MAEGAHLVVGLNAVRSALKHGAGQVSALAVDAARHDRRLRELIDAAKAALENGEDDFIPSEVVDALIDSENPVKVWREFRGLTQQQIADAAGISKPYLSQIETGKRKGSTDILSALAKALHVTLDEVVASPTVHE